MSVNLVIDVASATNQKQIFEKVAQYQEVFGPRSTKCGKCGSENVVFRVRTVEKDRKTYNYYEAVCTDCGARLSFGVHQTGDTLFPKRKDDAGNWLPNNGWVKFNKETGQEE